MEIYVELGVDVVRKVDWGWEIYQILLRFRTFFRHRGHRFLPGPLFFI